MKQIPNDPAVALLASEFLDSVRNSTANVVSARDLAHLEDHLADSLAGLSAASCELDLDADSPQRVVDVGSGGGFPAIPVAIVRPRWSVTMVESVQRKATFLEQTIDRLQLADRVKIICGRSEDLARRDAADQLRASFDLATCRALAAPTVAMELLAPLVVDGGCLALWSTQQAWDGCCDQLDQLGPLLGLTSIGMTVSPTSFRSDAVVIHARRSGPVPDAIPRRSGVAGKRPLVRKSLQ